MLVPGIEEKAVTFVVGTVRRVSTEYGRGGEDLQVFTIFSQESVVFSFPLVINHCPGSPSIIRMGKGIDGQKPTFTESSPHVRARIPASLFSFQTRTHRLRYAS